MDSKKERKDSKASRMSSPLGGLSHESSNKEEIVSPFKDEIIIDLK